MEDADSRLQNKRVFLCKLLKVADLLWAQTLSPMETMAGEMRTALPGLLREGTEPLHKMDQKTAGDLSR